MNTTWQRRTRKLAGSVALTVGITVAGSCAGGPAVHRTGSNATTTAEPTATTATSATADPTTSSPPSTTTTTTVSPVVAVAASLPAPDAGTGQATRTYLAGDGATLSAFRAAIEPLTATTAGDVATLSPVCTTVATTLGPMQPSTLITAAGNIPDRVLAQLYLGEIRLASQVLVACGAGDTTELSARLPALHDNDQLIAARLTQIGG